jgi:GDPmannose 4,6-dehydratase
MAREKLGWRPKTSFESLVAEMAREDLVLAQQERALRQGHPATRG